MLITRIELQNIKSYRDGFVTFAAGTNAICGANGAGKSTLLEAIGFTLFDYLPYTQADFVREGEKTATIAVNFVSDQDGREYQVVRRCGGSSDFYVYDPELDAKVTSGKTDVLDWVREHLGLESTADLPALFRDAVGVPQGLLTAPFLQTASQRKPLFDRLLRVDEYEQAWKVLRETLRYLENLLAGQRESIAKLEAQVQRLPGLHERAESLRADEDRMLTDLTELRATLGEATTRRELLEAIKNELDELTQKVEMHTARLEGVVEQLETAEKEVAEAEMARATLDASRSGHEAYEAAQVALAELEREREQRDKLREDRTSHETELRLAQAQVKGLETELVKVEEAEANKQALQPLVDRQRELEEALRIGKEQVRSLEVVEVRLGERQRHLADLNARLKAVQAGLVEVDRLEAELQRAQAQLEEARSSLADLKSDGVRLAAELQRLAEQAETLETTEAARCPVCEGPLTPKHRAELLARNRAQQEELRQQDQSLNENIATAAGACTRLERRIQENELQLRNLPRVADQEELSAQIRELQDELAGAQADVKQLEVARAEVASLEPVLGELGDPRGRYERLAETARERARLEEKLEAERHTLGSLGELLAEIEQVLAPFEDVDQRLDHVRAALNQHQADHRRYLENAKIAKSLTARRERAEALKAQADELSTARETAQTQAKEIEDRFDPQVFAAARQHETELQAQGAGLEGQLGGLRQQLAEIERETNELETLQEALAAEQVVQAKNQHLLAQAGFVREVIRQAGPYVTRRLMRQVSLEAARLFSEVMADPSARLRWGESYEIVLEKNGRDRGFQQLSGGEQMAAALSIRLALLRELSDIDVAFFDEPTSNLDDTRRDSLAEQILSVKGFSQLFIISHDDTFERATHHIVRVYKEDGVSRVDVQ